MYTQNYDTDCVTWSPAGRIYQIEYAMEAVKQGSCVVALRSKTHAVIVGLKRTASDLAYPTNKLMKIDDHVGMCMSGLTSDARVLSEFMRDECLHHKFVHDAPMPLNRLVAKVGDKSQTNTQNGTGRPFGVGCLIIGFDQAGPHVFETCPTGNFYEYYSMAIGGRSQSAKTYLEKNFESFENASKEQLIESGIRALNASVASNDNQELTLNNISVGFLSASEVFTELTKDELQTYLQIVKGAQTEDVEIA
eukprot:GDKJ01022758.1.p1 GENE.GDKJ01022758.1~~GDKJ01022758.1.p1  ORF type:complete len:250 (+),score=54.49 GDKJ01022758.1:52-801(+)